MLVWFSLHHDLDPSHPFGRADACKWLVIELLICIPCTSCAWLFISLPGPPITKNSSIVELITNKVVVGIGCERIWSARNLPFDVAWVSFSFSLCLIYSIPSVHILGCHWSWGPNFQRGSLCSWFVECREIAWCWCPRRPGGLGCDTRGWSSGIWF